MERDQACRRAWACPRLLLGSSCFRQLLLVSGWTLLWLYHPLSHGLVNKGLCTWGRRAMMGGAADVLYAAPHLVKIQWECPLWGLLLFGGVCLVHCAAPCLSCPAQALCLLGFHLTAADFERPLFLSKRQPNWRMVVVGDNSIYKWHSAFRYIEAGLLVTQTSLFTPFWMQVSLWAGIS